MTIALISNSVSFDKLLLQTNKLTLATLTAAVACALQQTRNPPQKHQERHSAPGARQPEKVHFVIVCPSW